MMKGVAALKFTSSKNCLGVVSPSFIETNHQKPDHVQVFCISAGNKVAYLSAVPSTVKDNGKNELCINGLYASKLGFNNGCGVLVETVEALGCASAWIEPTSVDDWEILELHAEKVENQLLDQIRVLWPGQIFPLWVEANICVFLKTVKVEPPADCSLLMPLTELVIAPKVDSSSSGLTTASKEPLESPKLPNEVLPTKTVEVTDQKAPLSSAPDTSKARNIVQIIYDVFLRRLFSLFKFLIIMLQKQIPSFFSRLGVLLYPSIIHKKSIDEEEHKLWLTNHVKNVPDGFSMIARVEPAMFEQSNFQNSGTFLANQPNTVFLHSNANLNHCQPDVYLVLMCKYLSPSEKLAEHRSKKFKHISEAKESNDDNKANALLDKCVVRLYVHPQSKFSMVRNWKMVYKSHHLKVPSCLRRQMNLSVSSKVCLQKLSEVPKTCKDVEAISFSVVTGSKSTITNEFIENAFKGWITGISDNDNPIPVAIGMLFVFTVILDEKNNRTSDSKECTMEAVVTDIKTRHDLSKSTDNTYLLSYSDFTLVQLKFNQVKRHKLPSSADLEPKIPPESILVYSKGLEKEIESLERFVDMALSTRPVSGSLPSRGLRQTCALVTGAKGTGKTVLCKSIMNKFATDNNLHAYVCIISCGRWRGKKPENVKRHCDELLHELLWRQPAVLFLDDLDQLIPASLNNDEEKTPDSVYTLQLVAVIKRFLQALSGRLSESWSNMPHVVALVTSKSTTSLHPSMTSSGTHLFSYKINIELPDYSLRGVLLNSLIENFTDYQAPSNLEEIQNRTEGYAAADLVGLIRRAHHLIQQKRFSPGSKSQPLQSSDAVLDSAVILEALTGYTPASLQNAHLHKPLPLKWKDVGGLASVKQKLQEQLLWPVKYRHLFTQCGLQPQSGVLLFGPPGCGKTLIAGVVAGECSLNFISIKGPEVLSKYIGASEAAVRDLFARARAAAPCVLFFDEFDSLAPKRGHDSTGVTDRVVNQLLTHLDGVEPLEGVTVMAASSRPDLLDPALLRPGRLDNLLYCPFPTHQERAEILKALSFNMKFDGEVDLINVALACENFSGADLKALLYNAQLEAVHETINYVPPFNSSNKPQEFSVSTTPQSSSSNFSLENDDLYQSNGLALLTEEDSSIVEGYLSKTSIESIKDTATDLINSLQNENDCSAVFKSPQNSYKTCLEDSVRDKASGCNGDLSKSGSKIVYFSALHQGRSETVPPKVMHFVDSLFQAPKLSTASSDTSFDSTTELIVKNRHIEHALAVTRPSVTLDERRKFESLYSNFFRSRERGSASNKNYYGDKLRATLS